MELNSEKSSPQGEILASIGLQQSRVLTVRDNFWIIEPSTVKGPHRKGNICCTGGPSPHFSGSFRACHCLLLVKFSNPQTVHLRIPMTHSYGMKIVVIIKVTQIVIITIITIGATVIIEKIVITILIISDNMSNEVLLLDLSFCSAVTLLCQSVA